MARIWYAVRTKPMKEFFAQDNLKRQGYETYLPIVKRFVSHARRKILASRPFFSGYLFVHLSKEEQNWTNINSTFGVLSAVRFGDVYPPVPDELIERLRAREDSSGHIVLDPSKIVPFRAGDRVLIRRGDALIEGLFKEMRSEDRAIVLIELLKRKVPVKVSVNDIETG